VGTNNLRIETGRWKRPVEKPEKRVCLQCNCGAAENEKHFILHCPRYQQLRAEMLNSLDAVNHENLITSSDEERWQNLMRNEKKPGQVSDLLKKYVRKAVALRREE